MPEKSSSKTFSYIQIALLIFCTISFTSPSSAVIAESVSNNSLCNVKIGSLQTNSVTLSISSCDFGVSYTIHAHDGEILAENIGLRDLVASFPDLAKNIEQGLAGNDARLMVID